MDTFFGCYLESIGNSFINIPDDKEPKRNIINLVEDSQNYSFGNNKSQDNNIQIHNLLYGLSTKPTMNNKNNKDEMNQIKTDEIYFYQNKEENEENKENKENKENQHNEDNKNAVLKKIKIYDLNKDKNTKNNGFEKGDGKNGDFRYFNVFGYEGEDISLTQIEKDCSGMIDSSTSNEIQMNPDYFFKEAPKNVFKIDKSNDQSVNSNNNEA